MKFSDNNPLVSICIPTYNGEEFIAEALSSALSQTWNPTEIILSDDGSTDNTLSIAESYREKTSVEFHVFKHPQYGLADNWNFCVRQSKGKYVKFLFQDDLLEPDCIEKMVSMAEQDNDLGLIFSPRQLLLNKDAAVHPACNHIYEKCKDLHKGWSHLKAVQSGMDLLEDTNWLVSPINKIGEPIVVLIKKAVFDKVGLFDKELLQLLDVDMWFRIMGHYKIGFIEKPLSTFRIHPKQETLKNIHRKELLSDSRRLCEKMVGSSSYAFLTAPLKEKVKRWFDNELKDMTALLGESREKLIKTSEELGLLKKQMACVKEDLKRSQIIINDMRNTKFWKLRQKWFKLKKLIGCPISSMDL